MRKILAAAVLALTLTACGDKPVPDHGTVTDHNFTPAWVQIIPGTTMCSGNPMTCMTTPMQVIPWPDQWSMTITDLNNKDWQGTVTDGDSNHYDKCPVGSPWPECWRGN